MANSNGGMLYIGLDDSGQCVGVDNPEKLLKELPNKIKNTLGIISKVTLIDESLPYISIQVDKYPVPISYHGKFYLRSGSNTHEITGAELDKIILGQLGKTWDSLPVPNAFIEDLDQLSIKRFRKYALESGRLTQKQLDVDDKTLLKDLRLYDGNNLTIAAILLFHEGPENWVPGSYIKLGYFERNHADLKYQDEIHGSLLSQVDRIVEIIYTKYLKSFIHYVNLKRQEEYIIPKEAFREIIYNSINHTDYSSHVPIQISVYADKIYIWNPGKLPTQLTKESLLRKHASLPHNPKIADTFFKAGFIEAWGRGFEKIKDECNTFNTPMPEIEINTEGIMIKCNPSQTYLTLLNTETDTLNGTKTGTLSGTKTGTLNGTKTGTLNSIEFLSDIEQNIISHLFKNPNFTQKDLSISLSIPLRTIKRTMSLLKSQNIIQRVGSSRKGHWIINK